MSPFKTSRFTQRSREISWRRFFRSLFPVLAVLACSCNGSAPGIGEGELKDQTIIPRGSAAIPLYGSARHKPGSSTLEETASLKPKVALPEGFLVQALLDMNIDLDSDQEQVVIYKTAGSNDDTLKLGLIDFDESSNTYLLTQSLPTLAINIRTFSLRLLDLTRNNIPELVASGLDAKGSQTLNIYAMSSNPDSRELAFTQIMELSADISIEIRKKSSEDDETPQEYSVLPEYQILSQSRSNSNTTDLLENSYQWNQTKGIFELASMRTIPGAQMQEEQLRDLQNASLEDFEKFVSGPWYRNIPNKKGIKDTQILFFEPETRSFRLIEGDRMESHIWKASTHPNLGARLQIFLENESLHIMRSMATVIPVSYTEMTFYLQDKEEWSGTFYRLSQEQQQEMGLGRNQTSIQVNPLVLSGLFKSETGGEIVFSAPWFTWRQGDKQRRGGYLTYQLGQTILELQSISEKGLVEEKEYYTIKQVPTDPGANPVYELRPVSITMEGPSSKGPDVIRIQQISTETN